MKRIVVFQRGWVVVGDVHYDGTEIVISKPAVVHRWGTSAKGLGYLAEHGPQPQTVLYPGEGQIRSERMAVVFQWDCDPTAWKSV